MSYNRRENVGGVEPAFPATKRKEHLNKLRMCAMTALFKFSLLWDAKFTSLGQLLHLLACWNAKVVKRIADRKYRMCLHVRKPQFKN